MKAEEANVFILSAAQVFRKELGVSLSRESLKRKETPVPSLPVSIVLGITGGMRGQVVYSMDHSVADEITHVMVPNKLPSERKKLVNSAVGEIGNMITGQASIALAGNERILHLTPPAVFTGKDLSVDFLEVPTVCLRLLSELGLLEINIGLMESEEAS
jgi:chemotaxis protein CheX